MKTIKLNVFLIAIIGILIGCHSKNENLKFSKKDSIKTITNKIESTKTSHSENCNCEENLELKDYISCEETVFSNGAKIYRQYNCDSSWLVFENKNLKKNIYSLEKELIEYTHKLGYVDWVEFKSGLLMYNKTASGCCYPLEFVFLDKQTGKEIINLGQAIYLNEEHLNPYFISLDLDNSKIRIYNLDTRKTAKIPFNISKIDSTFKLGGFLQFPEELFENAVIKNNIFKVQYSYMLRKEDKDLFQEIVIDLNKLNFN